MQTGDGGIRMTTRREQINKLSPEEYERAVVRSATLASELAEAQGQKPSIEVESILEKAKKTPGAIAKERSQGGWSVRISDGVTKEAVRKSGTPVEGGSSVVVLSPAGSSTAARPPGVSGRRPNSYRLTVA